jgi:membrane fusion protein (multidrug efflux system)
MTEIDVDLPGAEPEKRSLLKPYLLVGLGLLIVFGGVFGWKVFVAYKTAEFMANMPARTVAVSSTVVETEMWENRINAVGGLSAFQGVEVTSEVPGKITAINFESGQPVNKGDLLVHLDDTTERAQLRALQAELEAARLDHKRTKGLVSRSAVSQAQLDRATATMDSLKAQVDAQAELISKKAIRAPFNGKLGIRQVNLGEFVSPGTEIVTLQNLDKIFADFSVPERFLNDIQNGQTVHIEGVALEGEIYNGVVTAVSPKVEKTTRNVMVQATFDNPEGTLRPGMFVQISIVVGGAAEVMTLPQTAVSFLPYGNSVWLIVEGNKDRSGADVLTSESQLVQTGRIREGRIEIISGVEAGTRVVNTGQMKLRNGQFISINNSVELPRNIVAP